MAVFSVDSDAVHTASVALRGTIERLQSESGVMLGQLTQLQGSWTGSAAIAFQAVIDEWRVTQRAVEDSLASINQALIVAGQHYADAEAVNIGLFR